MQALRSNPLQWPRHSTPSLIGVEALIEVKKKQTLPPSVGSNPVCVIGRFKKSSSVIGKSLEYSPPQLLLLINSNTHANKQTATQKVEEMERKQQEADMKCYERY